MGRVETLLEGRKGMGRGFTVRHDFSQTNCNAVAAIVATVLAAPVRVAYVLSLGKMKPVSSLQRGGKSSEPASKRLHVARSIKRASNNNNTKEQHKARTKKPPEGNWS